MWPIKFRAWHEGNKEMLSPEEMGRDELTLNPDGRGFVNVNGTSPKLSQYYPHMVPMQFTGLYDKNKKEIYFEDIVLFEFKDGDKTYGGKARIVRAMNGGAAICHDWDDQAQELVAVDEGGVFEDFWEDESLWDLEVIGNAYQNPELIKKL